jgi:hypothetical protein
LSTPKNAPKLALVKGINLIDRIPNTSRKYYLARKIAQLFTYSLKVDKYEIIRLIKPTVLGTKGKSRRLTRKDYMKNKNKYDNLIINMTI